jgi:DNA-binding CsgD family transcriptional regulator
LEGVLRSIKELWLNRARLPYEQQQAYTRPAPTLTEREKQVLRFIAEDLTHKEIASQLGISEETVYFHVQRIRDRIGVRGTAG